MLFNSYPFFIFLLIVLPSFFVIAALNRRAAAAFLVLASIFFYAWWDPRFVLLLGASTIWNFSCGILLQRYSQLGRTRLVRTVLTVGIGGDLALLGYFKYTAFAIGIINQAAGTHLGPVDIILPLGISFFTFTQIAFLVDAARGEVREVNPINYCLFVTYFPHLIAGPILHHKEMMPQFDAPETYGIKGEHIAIGIAYFAIGLAKKCLLADSFAPDAAAVFNAPAGTVIAAPAAWHGAIAYTLQLYFDFSGYIDMAIGMSLLFNIRLPLNFDSPYKAASIIDFWRRWHMTLSRFLRAYLYIPLGGNRKGPARRYLNLMITMMLGGLWHGANWTFVAWGGLHGAFLAINHGWRAVKPTAALAMVPRALREGAAIATTFLCVIVAWVFFRAPDFATATRVLAGMLGFNGFSLPAPAAQSEFDLTVTTMGIREAYLPIVTLLFWAGALFAVFFLPNSQQLLEPDRFPRERFDPPAVRLRWHPTLPWAVVCAALAVASLLTFTRVSEFLYFQF